MGLGLRALRGIASSELIDRIGLRRPTERLVHNATKNGFRAAGAAERTFKRVRGAGPAKRQPRAGGGDLFDLTPTDEQQMLMEAMRDFAADQLRPAALDADTAARAPEELLAQANELGITALGIPEEHGGPLENRSSVTSALVAEALAHGDMGLAVAALAPGAVATAIGLWGTGDQQATYLPEFAGEDPPAGALALLEPGPLFNPFALRTKARRAGDGYVLDGAKALVPRAGDGSLFIVAAELEGTGPALFAVEAGTEGLAVKPEPGMGVRAAGTGRLELTDLRLPAGALLGADNADAYAQCVHLSRLAWCALAVGTAQAVLDYVSQYVNERHAFGEPISNRQAVAFEVSNIAIELEGLRLVTLRAASRYDAGRSFEREAALARRLAARHAMTIGSAGVQLLGGHGYVKEHPVERWYRDLRATGLMEGGVLL
jgi:hypothetical protein